MIRLFHRFWTIPRMESQVLHLNTIILKTFLDCSPNLDMGLFHNTWAQSFPGGSLFSL